MINQTPESMTTSIMLDESRAEHKSGQMLFPNARRDLCQLHGIKAVVDRTTHVDTSLRVNCRFGMNIFCWDDFKKQCTHIQDGNTWWR